MDSPTPAMQDLARRLIAFEAARERPGEPTDAGTRACERLRAPLARLMGPAGFEALLSRATVMARREAAPPEGPGDAGPAPDAGAGTLAHLLGLLATFIGEPLTLALVRDAWPDATEGGIGPKIGEGS